MGANWSRMAEEEAQREKESMSDSSSSEEEHVVSDDEDLVESSDDQRATRSVESPDSVSLKSDGSKEEVINFKDRVSPRPDSSSSEEEDNVSDDKDLVESPDNQG